MVYGMLENRTFDATPLFKILDFTNRDGKITTKELGGVLRSLGQNPSDSELHDLINQADYNKNGVIEFDEFLAWVRKRA